MTRGSGQRARSSARPARGRGGAVALRYPCTGPVSTAGFPAFLARQLGAPRANLRAFARELEREFSAKHVTLVNSGSSANLAAALALSEETGPGAEAIVAGFTFPTTVSSLLAAGFTVRVADIERDGFGLDPAALERAITKRTRVVAVTHFLGFPARLEEILRIARARRLLVLQDACETMGIRVEGEPAHARGAFTTWSFYHPHHLSSFGGGAVIASDRTRHRRVESLSHWGRACTCHTDGLACRAPAGENHHFTYLRAGHNLEMSELNAAFGRFQLARVEAMERARCRRYDLLHAALRDLDEVRVHARPGEESPFAFPVTVLAGSRADLARRLRARGVETRSWMGGAIVDQPAFRALPHDGVANARAQAARSFLVGVHQTLPEPDVRAVARILREEITR